MRRYYLHYHHQNLNTDKHDRPRGSIFWNGRAWVSVWDRVLDRKATPQIGWSWLFGRRAIFCHLHLEFNQGDHNITVSVALPFLFAFWVHLESIRGWRGPGYWADSHSQPGTKFWMPVQRQLGITWYQDTLRIDLWHNPMESSRSDPWWWHISIKPLDILLGRRVYSQRDIKTVQGVIMLPERAYSVQIELFESIWTRASWPWPDRLLRATVTPNTPIPIPGKGENSWDIDDDAVYSHTCQAQTAAAAAESLRRSVIETRERHGGRNWQPG